MNTPIQVYTDGSCHTQLEIGAWVAIIIIDHDKLLLSGLADNTTHHRMELMAVLKAMEWIVTNRNTRIDINVITESQ